MAQELEEPGQAPEVTRLILQRFNDARAGQENQDADWVDQGDDHAAHCASRGKDKRFGMLHHGDGHSRAGNSVECLEHGVAKRSSASPFFSFSKPTPLVIKIKLNMKLKHAPI